MTYSRQFLSFSMVELKRGALCWHNLVFFTNVRKNPFTGRLVLQKKVIARMTLFECVYGFPLSLMYGGQKAVISTVP